VVQNGVQPLKNLYALNFPKIFSIFGIFEKKSFQNFSKDEDCLQMSVYLPDRNYATGVIYFVTDSNPTEDLMELAYSESTAIFVINLRNGIFGYYHQE